MVLVPTLDAKGALLGAVVNVEPLVVGTMSKLVLDGVTVVEPTTSTVVVSRRILVDVVALPVPQ